jgi:hypothetical protein
MSGGFWDIGQVTLRNFNWLSFTPWSPSPILHFDVLPLIFIIPLLET